MSFRLSAKHIALTYSQANNITSRDIIDVIERSGVLEEYIVAHEHHADGGHHYHVYANYKTKRNIKTPSHFDVKGYHPNFEAVKDRNAWKTYCRKDGDYIEWSDNTTTKLNIIETCKTLSEEDFLEWCHENKVQAGYYHEAKRLCKQTPFNIEEDHPYGIDELYPPNQEQSILYSNHWHKNVLEPLLSGNQWYSSANQEQEKHPSLLSTAQSPDYLSHTLISLANSNQDTTNQSSSTTLGSRTFQEKAKSIWSTETLPELYTSDTKQHTFQRERRNGLHTTNSPSQ